MKSKHNNPSKLLPLRKRRTQRQRYLRDVRIAVRYFSKSGVLVSADNWLEEDEDDD